MKQDRLKYKNKTYEGMNELSYTIESTQKRAFYTYIHVNLNGMYLCRQGRRHGYKEVGDKFFLASGGQNIA